MQTLSMIWAAAASAVPVAYPADTWDQMYDIWILLAVVIYLIVAIPMLYFLFRYRYKEGVNEVGADEHGSMGIEILWTVIPLIIVIYLAVQGAAFYHKQRTPPPDAMVVKTEASMWAWQFTYDTGKSTYTELTVPVGKPVKLEMTSKDVIHAFHIPAAKTMEDAVPGRVTHLWFQFNETGEFPAFCREYCGTAHAYMRATIKVVSQDEFDQWVGNR
ncbi:MAG: cytochrome c oxidase subunit II [Gammaproteobacteria bacterium]|nr:cytochrome c oxidase subunit II [Gammaproteobacteria bacterium]